MFIRYGSNTRALSTLPYKVLTRFLLATRRRPKQRNIIDIHGSFVVAVSAKPAITPSRSFGRSGWLPNATCLESDATQPSGGGTPRRTSLELPSAPATPGFARLKVSGFGIPGLRLKVDSS